MKHRIDIISDTHWDFFIPMTDPEYAQIKKFNRLFDIIVPEDHSETLLIAGDLGHSNEMNGLAFELLKERGYKNILFVEGNHDYYLCSSSQARKYGYDSFKRLDAMIKIASKVEGVHYLNGNVINIEGLNVGGCGMWYNFQYGVVEHGLTVQHLIELWHQRMNDSRLIYVNSRVGSLDNLALFNEKYALLKSIYNQCDVVMSHIGPDWSQVPEKYKDPTTSFYYFDGSRLLESEHKPKLYLYGHTHDCSQYRRHGVNLICNPLGYPLDNSWYQNGFSQKIKTIEVEK